MAVATILSDLALRDKDNGTLLLAKYRQHDLLYDVIIGINSLEDLKTCGWEIILKKNEQKRVLQEPTSTTTDGVTVAILGAYNRGKIFLLSKLCNVVFPHNHLIHTEGISITAGGKEYIDIVFMDTAGTDTPVTSEKLAHQRATEALLREVVVHLSSFIIIVVNRLRATDQVYIDKVLEHCKYQDDRKRIIIVHNLDDIETAADVNKIIEEEIMLTFSALRLEKQFRVNGKITSTLCYASKLYNFQLNHFILAKDGSQAANVWNQKSLDGIMNILQVPTEAKRSFHIVTAMLTFINTRLIQLFGKKPAESGDDQDDLQIVQHDSQPYIVLCSRKHLPELMKDPHPMELSGKLVYDDGGYFIKNTGGLWEPRINFYENKDGIRLFLELSGFKKGELDTAIAETGITINGSRNDFGVQAVDIIHISQIPGKFTLNIPFKHAVDVSTVKSERHEGIIYITALKKNLDGLK
ncbi:unnamed protein product [Didymodactylos carnosus]|uniref:SHSP domain-containing protein n=1 Tax=Didymodactylos carnosus TaxID=1234261 RepID=A0A814IMR3_9BILA|nr:unnamed protein product [Didymodactylos carnosus]CAF1025617.1 unnamed protein product [Didymodactylos carnosus]CAF3722439.1 unnamed protein product [Didymodactylos carnosus]CAF3796801.1 unnamed protein product [Didymodactylos carnosus]